MKFVLPFALLLVLNLRTQPGHCQSVSINANGTPPDPSAILDVESTEKGLLP